MKRLFLTVLLTIPVLTAIAQSTEPARVWGDYNGDGKKEACYLVAPQIDEDNFDCYGECVCYIRFTDPTIPAIKVDNCIGGSPDNLGDINQDGKDEIGLLPYWFQSCWTDYYVWANKGSKWVISVDPGPQYFCADDWTIPVQALGNGYVRTTYTEMSEDGFNWFTKHQTVRAK